MLSCTVGTLAATNMITVVEDEAIRGTGGSDVRPIINLSCAANVHVSVKNESPYKLYLLLLI